MNPYLILGVPPEADDSTIRRAYLTAVKEAPPDTHPQRFQAVSAAYDQIKDEPSRRRHILFDRECPGDSPLDVLRQFARARRSAPLPFEPMKEYLRNCWKS
ncbi:MAG: J domain-containing protein [Limisphaerales bacterium]